MRTKTKKKKTSKKIWILLVLLFFGVIVGIGLYQSQRPVRVEFHVIQAGLDGPSPYYRDNGSVAIIYGVSIQFEAVGGDAHDVVVSWAAGPDIEPENIVIMRKDTPTIVSLASSAGYLTRRNDTLAAAGEPPYPVTIRVFSQETKTVKLTFYIYA